MIISKPKFWDKKISFLAILLLPLSVIFIIFIFLKKKFTSTKVFKIPIICIGNIYLGGTGKTPACIFLANELSKTGKKTVILRKYYKEHNDEYKLIREKFKNVIINKSRDCGIRDAERSDFDIVILDDGFQDYKIKKNLNIICFNQNQLIGNGLVLPSGPLRENLTVLKYAHIIIINGRKNTSFEDKLLKINNKLEFFYSSYKPLNLDNFKNRKLLALAGIGNPENFFNLMEQNNLKIEKKITFPDHYIISKNEIQKIINEAESKNLKIIMTEKDYFKINSYKLEKIDYLKISLEIEEKAKFIDKVKLLYDKNN